MTTTSPSIFRGSVLQAKAARMGADRGNAEVLHGGDRIRICPLHRSDRASEPGFLQAISPADRCFHFTQTASSPNETLRKLLPSFDPRVDIAYVVVIDDFAQNRDVAVGRLTAISDAEGCEFDVVVGEKWRQRGIGTRLMHHLIEAARLRGLRMLYSNDAADNARMDVFATRLNMPRDKYPMTGNAVSYLLAPRYA